MTVSSFLPGWPDVIICTGAGAKWWSTGGVHFYIGAWSDDRVYYGTVGNDSDVRVYFDRKSGEMIRNDGGYCVDKSIQQFIADGDVYNIGFTLFSQ